MKISRTLVIDADFDGDAFVWVMDSDKEGVELLAHMFEFLANEKGVNHVH